MLLNDHFLNYLKENNSNSHNILIATFYKFTIIDKSIEIKNIFNSYLTGTTLKGTIIIAKEGINATIAGKKNCLSDFFSKISKINQFKDLKPKYSITTKNPFLRMKIKIKKEIVTIGDQSIFPQKLVGEYIEPHDWNKFINNKDTMIIDTRNSYEVAIGTFKKSINPGLNNFREFPKWVEKNLVNKNISKEKKIGMFCTGGIRCEKSTSYLKKIGYKNVFHLNGGILKYLEQTPSKESYWVGDCFVFDYRVSVDHKLKKGNFDMCFACRMPINKKDKESIFFSEGKSCHHCFNRTSLKQKKRFSERQKQIILSKMKKKTHIGP